MVNAMKDEWGPWIKHDGKGCPCVGGYVQVELDSVPTGFNVHAIIIAPKLIEMIPQKTWRLGSWFWRYGCSWVIRYRIRRPRGMEVLDAILADLPEKVSA